MRVRIYHAVWISPALALAASAAPAPAPAQWTVSGTGLVSVAQHRVDAGYGVEPSSGVVAGGEVAIGAGDRLTVRFLTQAGSLHAAAPGGIDRDLAEVGGQVDFHALRWLAVQAGLRRRTYATMLARQSWTMVSLGAETRLGFSGNRVSGIVRGAMLPGVWVNGLAGPDLAFTVASGMEYHRGRATLGLLYSVERYRFPAGAAGQRREQVSALALRAGWSLKP